MGGVVSIASVALFGAFPRIHRQLKGGCMANREFNYDVAFSFVQADEETAQSLADALADRFRVFIYSREQRRLAGTDGMESFSNVFAAEVRVVVILYREGWGETPWTRVEQTAIRNRAFEEGFDFALFVNMTESMSLPAWVPKTQIYYGLRRFGHVGAASVIESRVEARGGEPAVESALDLAERLRRAEEQATDRATFLNSPKGVEAASVEIKALFEELVRLCQLLGQQSPTQSIRVVKSEARYLVLFSAGYSLTLTWILEWANELDGSGLHIRVFRGAAGDYGSSKLRSVSEDAFDLDVLSGAHGWRGREGERRFLSSVELADLALRSLLTAVHERPEGYEINDDW